MSRMSEKNLKRPRSPQLADKREKLLNKVSESNSHALTKRFVWYELVTADGAHYLETTAQRVLLPSNACVIDFAETICKENLPLKEVAGGTLWIYESLESFESRDVKLGVKDPKRLQPDVEIGMAGMNRKDPLIVAMPRGGNTIKEEKPVWKGQVPQTSISRHETFSVDFEDAMKELHWIHRSKFNRACSGCGLEWVFPMADNVLGAEFGAVYIEKSRKLWKDVQKDPFQTILCNCHTVRVEFSCGALLNDDSLDTIMQNLLCEALKPMFVKPPAVLSNATGTVSQFLKNVTESCGPIFIILDEIGKAFEDENLSDEERGNKVIRFFSRILAAWFPTQNVFFLVLGRRSFLLDTLPYVRYNCFTSYGYAVQRLNIN